VPRLLGWEFAELAPDVRKTFEVALHAGSAPALCVAVRRVGIGPVGHLGLTLLPPAIIGGAFEGAIERRLGGARSVCAGQVLGGMALFFADRTPEARRSPDALDHLAVGFAQVAALAPGVSRFGAALSAARLRGLSRSAAVQVSLRAALPVTVAAGALKGARIAHGDLPPELRPAVAVGAAAALLSGFASLPLLPLLERRRALRALACYRIALGVAGLLAASSASMTG
jgi:undecaprenyl-diphosphatase